MRWLLCLLLLTATASAAEPTAAQLQRARDLYDAATKHFRGGDMDQAATEFKEAYELSGNVELLWNLAQTHRLAKHYEQALFFYKQYRAAKPDLANQAALTKRIEELEGLIQEQRRAQSPPPGGAPQTQDTSALPATQPQTTAIVAQPGDVAVTRTVEAPRRAWYNKKAPMVVTGIGIAGVIAGAALLGVAGADASDAKSATTLPSQRRFNDDAGTFSTAGIVTLAAGGAITIVGGILLGVNR